MCAKSALRERDVGTENEMRVGDGEVVLVEEWSAFGHARFEAVRLDRDPPALILATLEFRRQHDVQKRVTGSETNPAPRRGLDIFEQETGVLVDPQIDRDIEAAAADFAKALQVFERLAGPQGSVFRKEVVGTNLVCDAEPPRELGVPRPANHGDVILRE